MKRESNKERRVIKRQLETRLDNGLTIDKEMGRKYGVSVIKSYKVVDKLVKGDYIFIHHNGYVFKANGYPHNLRDGVANRDIWTGETIEYIKGGDTRDIMRTPAIPTLQSVFGAGDGFQDDEGTIYGDLDED